TFKDGRKGIASGFVVDAKTVVTNFHVLAGASSAQLSFPSGAKVDVSAFAGVSPGCDLAMLVADLPPNTRPLRLVEGATEKGEDVRAFGTPNGLEWSVTSGIVSAVRSGDEVRTVLGRDAYDAAGYDR